jgi:GntR family transcriptional repressor for pyruvate dehydrogenase complex
MTAHFDRIPRRTLAEEVRDALLRSIRAGELASGSRFPSERVLCEEFGVARTSVREAIHGLISLGVVERRGNRAYIAERLPEVTLPDARKGSVQEIFEVRRLVEVPMAELAACRATPEQRAQVAEVAATFAPTMSLEDFRAADHRFHAAVAAGCGNPSLAELYGKVLETLFRSTDFESLLTAAENEATVRRVIHDATQAHADIAASLVAGDAPAVRRAVERHLNQVEAHMVAQMT